MRHRKASQEKQSDYCHHTGKKRFRDSREATRRLQQLHNLARECEEHGRDHTIHVVRKYHCAMCQGWHLTSWENYAGPSEPQPQPLPIDRLVLSLAASTGLGRSHLHLAA